MRKKILAANWKMNLSFVEAQVWLSQFKSNHTANNQVDFQLYAPSLYLQSLAQEEVLSIGAQNVHPSDSGAFTGELSISQLKSVGAHSVLIGHSERRQYFHESNAFLKEKVNACSQQDFAFIFCCGEDLETRQSGEHLNFITNQLQASLLHVNPEKCSLVTIAYEPIWAIGTGETADPIQINEVHAHIRQLLRKTFGEMGTEVAILYGGSVYDQNAKSIFACPDVDGGLIGGASLNAQSFIELAHCF